MSGQYNRRSFLKKSALITAGSIIAGSTAGSLTKASGLFYGDNPDLAVVKGNDYYQNTIKAVDALGGIKKFVSKGSKAGLLINSRYNKPGTFVKPEISLAAVTLLLDSGVREIISLERVTSSYWQLSAFSKKHNDKIKEIKNADEDFVEVPVPGGISLKKAEVVKDFLDCDTFINIAIFKDHEGIKKTGNLKNLMGLTSFTTNRYFHFGSDAKGWYSDVTFLSQCIADINLLRKPALCICDATEYITTNGPFGPGTVKKSHKIIAGTDRVAVDAYGAVILGFEPDQVLPIKMSHNHNLGEIDLKKINIKEITA